ncbi:hypothetical protein BDA96_03G175400 [Sorghum bicolor]|uniref:Uncharacterized protein n=1 Tax=Sorghum bicolor TaxID=4558 RepID=A0A921REI1_SORBI|nr:hypothetical protein BDA96_03G175400 [Sorghum bicolor]
MYRHGARIHDIDAAFDPVPRSRRRRLAASDPVRRGRRHRRRSLQSSSLCVRSSSSRRRPPPPPPLSPLSSPSPHARSCLTSNSLMISCFSIYDYEYASHPFRIFVGHQPTASMPAAQSKIFVSQIIFLTDCFQPPYVPNYFSIRLFLFVKCPFSLMAMFLHQFHCCFAGKMAPRPPPRVPRRTVAEIDREFDELCSALSNDPRDQMTSGAGQIATRLRSHSSQPDNACDQVDSDVAMDENNQINAAAHNTKGPVKSGRKVTINDQLRKRRAKGRHIDIKFPKEFAKVCGEHASLFKSEITVLVRTIPLQVKKWKEMDEFHPGTTTSVWKKLKEKFPELSEEDKDCAMRQVESQYNNRRYRLLQAYRNKKPRPQHVSPEGWQWLIRNLWTDDDFQRNPETGEWPTAMQVWRATYQKADGTWSIPTGEEIMTKLDEAAGIHQEKISSAPIPIVEHFALVLGRKPNHSRGVGIRAVNKVAEERMRLQAQVEASEQREAAARARADAAEQRAKAAEQRAQALEGQVSTVVETNAQLQEEQQSHRDALSSLRQAQSGEVARLVREQLDQQMAELVARIHSGASQPPAS